MSYEFPVFEPYDEPEDDIPMLVVVNDERYVPDASDADWPQALPSSAYRGFIHGIMLQARGPHVPLAEMGIIPPQVDCD